MVADVSTIYASPYNASAHFPLFNEKVNKFLDKADASVEKIDSKGRAEKEGGSSGVFNFWKIKLPSSFFLLINNRNTQINTGRGRREAEDEMGGAARVLIGFAAAAVGGVALFFFGKWWNEFQEAGENLNEIKKFKKYVKKESDFYSDHLHLEKIKEVAKKEEGIFSRIRYSHMLNVGLTIAIVAAAALTLTGVIVNSVPVVLGGVTIGVITGAAALLKIGLEFFSKQQAKDAKVIRDDLEFLKNETSPCIGISKKYRKGPEFL